MYFTDHAENAIADMMRGQGLTLPDSWWIGLIGSVSSEASPLELAGVDYARQEVVRSLTTWAGTQGAGTTVASSGTSHASSNNDLIDFGNAGAGGWGTAEYVGLYDAATGGNCWAYVPITPMVIGSGDPVSFAAGDIAMTLALTGGMSNYLANKLIDLLLRDQAYAWPATAYVAYTLTVPTNAAAGAEPLGGYSRVAIASSLTAWLSTQGDTAPSTGVSGMISNASAVVFPVPTADQGDAQGWMLMDAAVAGNHLAYGELLDSNEDPAAFTINAGGAAPRFEAGDLTITVA